MKKLIQISLGLLGLVFLIVFTSTSGFSQKTGIQSITNGKNLEKDIATPIKSQGKNDKVLPGKWMNLWSKPSVDCRPLQIVHGQDIRKEAAYFKDSCGLGGVVCNVSFDNYLCSEENWQKFTEGVKAMRDNGLRVWIYDEEGYPSLGAGGRVLETDPSLEAKEMAYDKDSSHPYTVRPCYEYTHASQNYHAWRHYPNPLNPKSTETFIKLTHLAYSKHLGSALFSEVEAFFTDEPSMMAVNLGEPPESVIKKVKVIDPLDPKKKKLPVVTWSEDLPVIYKEKYGEDLKVVLPSLFMGSEEKDKVIRQKFWSLLGELDKKYYYDAIRNWCNAERKLNGGKGPVSSGHTLREEDLVAHVPLDGNKLPICSAFDIPGLDQLSSDPTIWQQNAWMAAFFPNSAAALNGQRRVMCEMSEHAQRISGKGPVTVQEMQASAAWQMAFGVTDFTLYYKINNGEEYPFRKEAGYKEYCDFVGRINSLVMEASPERKVLLYYPIYDVQREYIPSAEKINRDSQSELTRKMEGSFRNLGANLLKAQTQFVLVDYLTLEKAKITSNKTIQLGPNQYSSLIFPAGIVIPPSVSKLIEQARNKGIKIVFEDDFKETLSPESLSEFTGNENKLLPASTSIAFGKFIREGREIFLLVNTGKENYRGELKLGKGNQYIELDPQTGKVSKQQAIFNKKLVLDIKPLETKVFVVF